MSVTVSPQVYALAQAGRIDDLRLMAASIADQIEGAVTQKVAPVNTQAANTILQMTAVVRDAAASAPVISVVAGAVTELSDTLAQLSKYRTPTGVSGLGSPEASLYSANPFIAEDVVPRAQVPIGVGAPPLPDLFSQAVNSVTLKSQFTPDITYAPGAPGQPAQIVGGNVATNSVLNVIKPELDIQTPAGVVTMAPYGVPTGNYFWPAVTVAALGGGVLVYYAIKGIRATARGR